MERRGVPISSIIIFILCLLLSSSATTIPVAAQSQNADSCSSNGALVGLSGLPFDPSSLRQCLSAWTSRNYILRYSQASSNVWNFLLSAPDVNSYVAVGFSPDGQMVGSSAVVGWSAADGSGGQVKQYYLGGQTPGQVVPDQGNLVIATSAIVSQQSRLFMAFQLNASQPSDTVLYSLGPAGTLPAAPGYALTEHRDKVATTLNYVTGAIGARYFKHMEPVWFYGHVLVQGSAFVLGTVGVIAGLVLEGNLSANVSTHKGLGIFILVLGCLQVMAILIRPEKSSKYRSYWNLYHYAVGRILIAFAVGNVFYGIHLGGEGSGWNGGYGVALAVLFVIAITLELRMRLKE
ncbi:unnamed protein product [Linum tenue]|uniref:Cytochrome b561 and DOMON domain-containing protein n=1 Tax=Linum tenue TaxID=586396 RepID=A0AAV0HG14_9ROSI|nr:unnamed protein product [Linum tenue]